MMTEEMQRLVYVYAEHNPNWIYGGWHFYHVPLSECGEPLYDHPERCWLKAGWVLRELFEKLEIACCQDVSDMSELVYLFHQKYPYGALLALSHPNGYHFSILSEQDSARVNLVKCSIAVHVRREKAWYADDAEGQNLPAADLVKRLEDAEDTCRARGESEAADTVEEARRYIESLLRLVRESRNVLNDWLIGDGDGDGDMDELTDKILPSVCDALARALS